jgi:hypothetical protein
MKGGSNIIATALDSIEIGQSEKSAVKIDETVHGYLQIQIP